MSDRRDTTDRTSETFQSPDAPDMEVRQGRPDPVSGDALPEARARVSGTSLEGPNRAETGGAAGISMGILWTVVILMIVAAAVILYFAL